MIMSIFTMGTGLQFHDLMTGIELLLKFNMNSHRAVSALGTSNTNTDVLITGDHYIIQYSKENLKFERGIEHWTSTSIPGPD